MDTRRYRRQIVLPQIGEAGQRRWAAARIAIVGMGALGSTSASLLARAGVGCGGAAGGDTAADGAAGGGAPGRSAAQKGSGAAQKGGFLRLIDRDYVSLDNLQRSSLYTEADAASSTPKAIAAAEHLRTINSEVACDPRVTQVSGENIESLLADIDLVIDGSDNFELRYLLNEACDSLRIPWVYGGVLGTSGMVFPIVPGQTPCFRCLSPREPLPGSYPTCASAGVLGTVSTLVASLQTTEALKLILGAQAERASGLIDIDLWHAEGTLVPFERKPDCPTCGRHSYELLNTDRGSNSTALCGRDEYQVVPARGKAQSGVPGEKADASCDLARLAERLRSEGDVLLSPYLLTFDNGTLRFKLFADGRMMLKGVPDEAAALSVYAEYVGL
ncbi:MAG: ThiF family adenylyltransferase [Coriobacteriales bacterium]|jgi:adenylyltransferase/sulfurtransferase|nr:ThiF family adenylyltransferase [Coriobacteriales bacterium]